MRVRGPGAVATAVMAVAVVAIVLAVALGAAGASVRRAPRAPAACRAVPRGAVHVFTPLKGRTPVLLVHGFSGMPADFSRSHNGSSSMVATLEKVPGVATITFDYSKYALQWVTNPHVGPALAAAIVCLAARSGHHVMVVGHSMGGLDAVRAGTDGRGHEGRERHRPGRHHRHALRRVSAPVADQRCQRRRPRPRARRGP